MKSATLSSDHAVCAWIPLFALRVEEERRPDLLGKPTALLSADDTRRLWQVSPRARHAGVRAGMTVSQAIGLCSSLALLEADPVYYDECFSSLALALGKVSPVVEPVELGRVYIGVDGLETLHGSAMDQLRLIARTIRGPGIPRRVSHNAAASSSPRPLTASLRLGYARGKFVAWVAASRAKPVAPIVVPDDDHRAFLASQSTAVLPIQPDTHRRLFQLGINTLSDLTALPEEAIASQFGNEGRTAWRLAAGEITECVTGHEKPEPITATVDFPTPIADRQILNHTLDKLTERALRHPRRIGWRVYGIRARASLEHGASWMASATPKDPSANGEHLTAPLKLRLEQSPPAGAIVQLTVEFTAFVRGTTELQLFARDAAAAARTGRQRALRWAATEIKTRLDRPMLHHIIEVHPWSRIPERRYALIDFDP